MLHSALLAFTALWSFAQASSADTCGVCVFPCARTSAETFTLRLTGGRKDPGQVFTHIQRDTILTGTELVQAYRLNYLTNGKCKDTLVVAAYAESLVMGLTLGKTPPLYVPVRPVAEYVVTREPNVPASFLEVGGLIAYGGTDESITPQIGFGGVYFGAEALVAPFGTMLGENLALALGGGAMLEGGRLRFPALGHLRYTFASTKIRQSAHYLPDACQFSCEPSADTIAAPEGAIRRPGPDSADTKSILVHEKVVEPSEHAPYVFVEGGILFNSSFEGAGPDPSINRDDYGQWLAGGGLGIPVFPWLHAQLAYRFSRLNLRTPCVNCVNVFQVNTNEVHAILLRVALHWGW